MLLNDKQAHISPQRGMPIEDFSNSSKTVLLSNETVQLYYYNGGVLTIDAGEAAGTIVVGKLNYGNIATALGDVVGSVNDTSLSFTAGALTTEVQLPDGLLEAQENQDPTSLAKATAATAGLSNGEYCIDYVKGVIYGLKTTTATTLADTTYKTSSTFNNDYRYVGVIRTGAILTTSYVAGTVISGAELYNQLIVYITFTKGSLTSAEIKLEFSHNGTDYFQETFQSISAGTATESAGEHTITTGDPTTYTLAIPIKHSYIKISAKGTGTVTSSSMAITAALGIT